MRNIHPLKAYPIEDVCPPFKSDTLEHSQHGEAEVVEVCDSEVWTLPEFSALVASGLITLVVAPAQGRVILVNHLP